MSASNTSIEGGWLGTYAYRGSWQEPVRFEATFSAGSTPGKFGGTILDDCYLGEADVVGEVSGLEVRFTKVYREPGNEPVEYRGVLSEDGKALTGSWSIRSRRGRRTVLSGPWDAHRRWTYDENLSDEWEDEERETTAIGPSLERIPAGIR